jgi:Putative transposase
MMSWPPARKAYGSESATADLTSFADQRSGRATKRGWKTWRYIIRASFSQERMMYVPAHDSADGKAKVIYESKDGKTSKTFDALDWLAQLVTHIPNLGEQMVRYYAITATGHAETERKSGKMTRPRL